MSRIVLDEENGVIHQQLAAATANYDEKVRALAGVRTEANALQEALKLVSASARSTVNAEISERVRSAEAEVAVALASKEDVETRVGLTRVSEGLAAKFVKLQSQLATATQGQAEAERARDALASEVARLRSSLAERDAKIAELQRTMDEAREQRAKWYTSYIHGTELNCGGTQLDPGMITELCAYLSSPSAATLTALKMERCEIGDDGARALAAVFRQHRIPPTVWLDRNNISDEGTVPLVATFANNTTLREFSLHQNRVGDAGARALGAMFRTNRSITKIWLTGNIIADAGAQALAEGLQHNNKLTWINLNSNRIGDAGATAVATMLNSNRSIVGLGMSMNRFSESCGEAITAAWADRSEEVSV